MLMRSRAVVILVSCCIIVPIFIGASCPPPSTPSSYSVITDDDSLISQALASCESGFVCIVLSNQTSVPVQMALYTHDGYDPADQYPDTPSFACCTNPNSTVACPCPCPGKDDGECMLNFVEIFQNVNLNDNLAPNPINLLPSQDTRWIRIRCQALKTIAAAVADATGNVLTNPTDQDGPVYRDVDVPCGETIMFFVEDQGASSGGTGQTEVVTLIIQRDISR
ncbi:MAG: hypothetical protein JSV03_09815 [Planctomycetota bacterium]|nr:MAG: hypothetical protein JSV03_09815 [Planctomycetota bacterium]